MLIGADIVHIENVDPRQAEALKAVLERAHDPVIRIVVDRFERQRVSPAIGEDAGRVAAQQPADLGRQHPFAPRTVAQHVADATLGLADPVVRRGIDVAHAGGPGGAHDFFCGGARDSDLAAAQGGTAKTELGYLQARVPDLSRREFSRLTVLRSGRSAWSYRVAGEVTEQQLADLARLDRENASAARSKNA